MDINKLLKAFKDTGHELVRVKGHSKDNIITPDGKTEFVKPSLDVITPIEYTKEFNTSFTKKSKYNVTMYNVKKNNFKQAFSSKNYFNIKVQDLNFKGNDNKINNLTLDSSSTVAA